MNTRRFLLVALAATFVLTLRAAGADPAPPRIGVVNAASIFNRMAETQMIKRQMDSDLEALDTEKKRRETEVQAALTERNNVLVDSPIYQEKQNEYLRQLIDFRTWSEVQQSELNRRRKASAKALFDKIQAAVQDVAVRKHLDVVLTEQPTEISSEELEGLKLEQLYQVLFQNNVLYKAADVDITEEVLTNLDAKFNQATTQP